MTLSSALLILFALAVLVKVSTIIKNVLLSILEIIGILIGIRFLLKWLLTPLFKLIVWIGKNLYDGGNWLFNCCKRKYDEKHGQSTPVIDNMHGTTPPPYNPHIKY